MRRFIIFVVLISLVLLTIGISTQVALATARPLRPGHPIFPLQDFGEQARASFIFGETDQATYYLELAAQRTEDLVILRGDEHAILAVNYLNQALDRAIKAIVEAPEQDLFNLSEQLSDLILRIDLALGDSSDFPSNQAKAVENLQAKLDTLVAILAGFPGIDQLALASKNMRSFSDVGDDLDGENNLDSSEVPPYEVLFPPGSPGAEHEFFPLEGEHASLDCLSCHSNAQYAGTPNLCIDCHLREIPDSHFSGECSTCHSPYSWQQIDFDHRQIDTLDCQLCHLDEEPDDHYNAQCSACHNTVDWEQADFNHQAVDTKDCQFCHSNDKPMNHYRGQCSVCHNTSDWAQADFNHQAVGATDCKACHANKKPSNHYSGQCSACHNTSNWAQASFNHQAVGATDCKACHSGNKPANHWGGQCSACHNTSFWSEAKFSHSAVGATDCKACHSGKKPANHFGGQCSQCHSTSSWSGASFNHSFPMNHGGANGNCSKCHPSGGAKYNCYACHDKGKTINKHNEEGISSVDGRCLDCHTRGGESGDHGESGEDDKGGEGGEDKGGEDDKGGGGGEDEDDEDDEGGGDD
jgi:hypothetical protein